MVCKERKNILHDSMQCETEAIYTSKNPDAEVTMKMWGLPPEKCTEILDLDFYRVWNSDLNYP